MKLDEVKAKRQSAEADLKVLNEEHNKLVAQQEKLVTDAGGFANLAGASLEEFQKRNPDLAAVVDKKNAAKGMIQSYQSQEEEIEAQLITANPLGSGNSARPGAMKSLGEMLTTSDAYRSAVKGGRFMAPQAGDVGMAHEEKGFDFRSIRSYMQRGQMGAVSDLTTSNVAVWPTLLPGITPFPLWPPRFADFLPKLESSTGVVKYRQETAVNNNAAARAEASGLAQSDFTTVPVTDNAQVIGTYYKVSEEMFADAPYMRSFLDTQGLLGMQIAVENQLLTGNGAGNNLLGFYNRGVSTFSPAGYTDSNGDPYTNVDSIATGLNQARVNGVCDPSLLTIHTTNMLSIRELKNKFGNYIYGNPSDFQDIRIWGVPIYETPRAILNTALGGDFTMYSSMVLFPSMPLVMEYARVGNDRTNLEWTLVIYMRAALQVRRLTAFVSVSGLN